MTTGSQSAASRQHNSAGFRVLTPLNAIAWRPCQGCLQHIHHVSPPPRTAQAGTLPEDRLEYEHIHMCPSTGCALDPISSRIPINRRERRPPLLSCQLRASRKSDRCNIKYTPAKTNCTSVNWPIFAFAGWVKCTMQGSNTASGRQLPARIAGSDYRLQIVACGWLLYNVRKEIDERKVTCLTSLLLKNRPTPG